MTRTPAASSPDLDNLLDDDASTPGVLIVEVRPSRLGVWLLPPFLLILLASGLIFWRVRSPDWHWTGADAPPVAEAPPAPAAAPKPQPEPEPPALALAEVPVIPEPEPEAPADPAVAAPAPAGKNDIAQEAERIRAEREEMERLKQEEGERIEADRERRQAQAQPFGFGFGRVPPEVTERIEAMRRDHEEARQQADAMFQQLMRDHQDFAALHHDRLWGIVGGPIDTPRPGETFQSYQNRMMEEAQRRSLEIEEEMRRHLDANPPDFERGPAFQPGMAPRVRRSEIITPNGRIITFRSIWGAGGDR